MDRDGVLARKRDTSSMVKGVKKKMGHMCGWAYRFGVQT